ncbi:MAG: hypothetical protein RLZZ522_928 [Verrucomicrobiota bacterium]
MTHRAMIRPLPIPRAALSGAAILLLAAASLRAAIPTQLVLQTGRYIPIAAVALQGDKFVVSTATPDFIVGSEIPLATVDHVFGDKPVEINQAIALLLAGEPNDALRLLEPLLLQHKDTAKLPGNFWVESARAAVVANSIYRKAPASEALVKAISDASPAQGRDPIGELSAALLLPEATKIAERIDLLATLATDTQPADLCAYASYFRGEWLKKAKREPEALLAYLSVSCLYPSGGMVISGAAQFKAAEILAAMGRSEEALALVTAALRGIKGTTLVAPATQLLQSLKKVSITPPAPEIQTRL